MQKSKLRAAAVIVYAAIAILFTAFFIYLRFCENVSVREARTPYSCRVVEHYSMEEIEDPSAPIGVRREYRWTMDDIIANDTTLFFYLVHHYAEVYFDNELMYRYLDKLDKAGITVPVDAGIMPITNANQIKRTVSLSGASLPPEFTKMIGLYEHDSKGLFEAGIDYAVDQIRRLIDHGIDGIHLYIMNSPEVAKRVYEGIKDLL